MNVIKRLFTNTRKATLKDYVIYYIVCFTLLMTVAITLNYIGGFING